MNRYDKNAVIGILMNRDGLDYSDAVRRISTTQVILQDSIDANDAYSAWGILQTELNLEPDYLDCLI